MDANSSRGRRRALAVLLGLTLLVGVEGALWLFDLGAEPGLFERRRGADGAAEFGVRASRLGTFNDQSFAATKARGGLRVFCLGGSSTYGFPWDAEVAYCERLGALLRAARPGLTVEAVNCGGMSLGSAQVGAVFSEALRYEPDALIVDTGHNEYVQARFAAARAAGRRPWTSHLRLTRLLADRLAPLRRSTPTPPGDFFGVGPARDDSRRLPRTAAEDARVETAFEAALDSMARQAADAGVPLLLIRPAANLRDWAPEGSAWSEDLPPQGRQARDRAVASGQAALDRGDAPDAVLRLRAALEIDPQPAQVWFLLGRALLSLNREAEARQALAAAVDRDIVPIRLTTALGARVGRVWERHGLVALDMNEAFAERGVPGREVLIDYWHPTAEGHDRIARFLLPPLWRMLWPDEAPPPPGELPLPTPRQSHSAFGSAWIGQMLLRQGQPADALSHLRRAVQLDPSLPTAREGLGRALAMTGDRDGAVRELTVATELDPTSPLAWNNLGLVEAAAQRPRAAIRAYREALRVGGGTGEAIIRANLAQALAEDGRMVEARAEIDLALAQSPADPQIRLRSGEVAERDGDLQRARADFARALELDPGSVRARDGLARTAPP